MVKEGLNMFETKLVVSRSAQG